MSMRTGKRLLIGSLITRLGVVLLLCFFAMLTEYVNLKTAYNHPRLVELGSGKAMRIFYESVDGLFGLLGDPLKVAQSNGGMTWSIRVMGVPFTDPVSGLSVLVRNHRWETGFALGMILPLLLAVTFGRVFCSHICPASLLFFSIARLRRLLERWLLFPNLSINRGLAWGLLAGGLGAACWSGYGIWTFLLPYLAMGQTIFNGIAMGTVSVSVASLLVFSLVDLILGRQFTCRHLCPTGRLLGWLGRRAPVSVRRDATRCVASCTACGDVCPMRVNPKLDQTVDCSLCGECLVACPSQCLTIGFRSRPRPITVSPAVAARPVPLQPSPGRSP